MENRIFNHRSVLTAVFSAAFVFALVAAAALAVPAQRRFDAKTAGTETELKGVAQFAQNLIQFADLANQIEKRGSVSDGEITKLQDSGRRIKDGTSTFRGNLQGLISKLKSGNRWNDEFDTEFLDSITNPRVKAFIKRLGGARKALTEAEAAINTLSRDVDATINETKALRSINAGQDVFFMNASFSSGGGKVRLKCVLLGVGVAAAEVARLKLTAENLDNLFDSNKCGSAGGAPTTE
jgi:hypothetical protein